MSLGRQRDQEGMIPLGDLGDKSQGDLTDQVGMEMVLFQSQFHLRSTHTKNFHLNIYFNEKKDYIPHIQLCLNRHVKSELKHQSIHVLVSLLHVH